ncbi:MAG: isoprenylcysteine carboxylmethyltransferase family protein [Bacteroidota bacterium]
MKLKVPPPILFLSTGLMMFLTARYVPLGQWSWSGAGIVSKLFFVLGFFCAFPATWQFRKLRTTIDPRNPQQTSTLVRTGLYRISRNPMYLGLLLVLVGWFFHLGQAGNLLWLLGFVIWMNRFQIKAEEEALAQKFGAEYEEYKKQVRPWL